MPSLYSIRAATHADLPVLLIVEKEAARQFRQTRHREFADWPLASADIDLEREWVWVAADFDNMPVGFAIVRGYGKSLHIQEIDVHPAHARRGLGAMLIEHIARTARDHDAEAITLTTFSDVPWNAPYYARLGFRILDNDSLPQHLQTIREYEASQRFPMQYRVCMQFDMRNDQS
jgi:N-acetylglutamate synthase-like GNAT family acetyltransferase